MNGLRRLFAEIVFGHLRAKAFALALALVTVYLIDRYQNEPIVWFERSISVVDVEQAQGRSNRQEIVVVIQPDAGLLFLERPSTLKLRVRGPKKQRDRFIESIKRIELRGLADWVAPGETNRESVKRRLEPADFVVPEMQGVEVQLLETVEVRIDMEVDVRGVRLVVVDPPAASLPPDKQLDHEAIRLTPPTVTLRGPRSIVSAYDPTRQGGAQRLPLQLRAERGFFFDGMVYPAIIDSESAGSNQLSLVGLPNGVDVDVKLRDTEVIELSLGETTVRWTLSGDLMKMIQDHRLRVEAGGAGAISLTTQLTLQGSIAEVERHLGSDERKRVKETIVVMLDEARVSSLFTRAAIEGRVVEESVPLVVKGIPVGLSLKSTSPETFTIKVLPISDKKD